MYIILRLHLTFITETYASYVSNEVYDPITKSTN